VTYWLVCLVLLGFGYLAGFSIGPPFFYLGVGMLVLSPVRRWNFVFWPLLLAVIAFQIAYFSVTALMTWVVMRRGRVSDGPSDG
jgi:hypothetical protein